MRSSLKSLRIGTILVALCVALWATHKSVRPLREELLRTKVQLRDAQAITAELQAKLGVFPDVDPKQIQAMRVNNPLGDLRRLRVFLPKGNDYFLHVASGHFPVHGVPMTQWRAIPRVNFEMTTGKLPAGEYTIDIQPLLVDDEWKLRITELADRRGHTELSLSRFSEWIDDRRTWDVQSVAEKLVRHDREEPLILFRLHRGILKEFAGGFSLASPQGTADGMVVWIDQNPG
jgi:hypothetical protein